MIYLDSIIYSSGRLGAYELKKAQIFYLVSPISTVNKNSFCKIKILDKFLEENYGQNASKDRNLFYFDQSAVIRMLKV